jgi:hypothetical protein
VHTSFKHIVSHLDDLKAAIHRISDVEKMIREHEWKRSHTSFHSVYCALVSVCLILIGLCVAYKLYNCLKRKVNCVNASTDTNGSGNVNVN